MTATFPSFSSFTLFLYTTYQFFNTALFAGAGKEKNEFKLQIRIDQFRRTNKTFCLRNKWPSFSE